MGSLVNEDHFRYVLKTSNTIKDDERRFNYIRNQIILLEEYLENGEDKSSVIKGLVTWALKFESIEKYKYDKRMLDIWKLMGKYSENMGMDGVLENLHRIGYFKTTPEFYQIWAEHWGAAGNRDNFNKIVKICEENCHLSQFEGNELFRPLIALYFGGEESMDGKTIDLIKMLATRPEDVRSELTLFHRPETDAKQNDAAQRLAPLSAVRNSATKSLGSIPEAAVEPVSTNQEATAPPPLNANQEEVFAEAAVPSPKDAILQPAQPLLAVNREEFSIFKDPTSVIQAPPAKKKCQKLQIEAEVQERENTAERANDGNDMLKKRQSVAAGRRQSFYPDLDDVTMAGSHGKFSSAMLTSTPRRSIIPPDNFFPDLDEVMPTTETIIDQATSSNAMPRDEQARHRVLRDASVMPCILSSFFADPTDSAEVAKKIEK